MLVVLFVLYGHNFYAQKPVYEWMRAARGASWDEALAIACDDNGNSISTGYFEGSFHIGDSTFNSDTYADVFLIRHDSKGDLAWAKQLSCQSGAWGNSVLLDENGNSVVTGFFSDSISVNSEMYYGYFQQTGFIAKFDQHGHFLWFHIMGGENGWMWPADLMYLNNGNIICAGIYGGTITIGDSLISTNDGGTFLAQYSSTGDFIKLSEPCSGTINDIDLLGIAADGMDNMYIGGNFQGTLTFSDTSISSAGYQDIFIAKFDDQGNFLWARQEGDISSELGMDVAADPLGNSAITGYFTSTLTVGDTTFTASGSEDIFIIKYDPDGNFLWARTACGNVHFDLDEANGITADKNGNFYLAGNFEGSASFGDTTLISRGSTDIFCAKFNSAGDCIWAAKIGGSNEEWGDDIAINDQGDIFITGWYSSTITFGDTVITNTDAADVCVIKLTESDINSVYNKSDYPGHFILYQNYPNPFNPGTVISWQLAVGSHVDLSVYNLLGEKVATLVSRRMNPGSHTYAFDGRNLASGVYYYQLVASDPSTGLSRTESRGSGQYYREVKKMILLK